MDSPGAQLDIGRAFGDGRQPGPWALGVDIGGGGAGGTGVISIRQTGSGGPVIPLEQSYTCRGNTCGAA